MSTIIELRALVESYRTWPNAIKTYAREIKFYLPHFDTMLGRVANSGDMNPAELNRFADYLREKGKWAQKTIDKLCSALTALWEYAHGEGIVEHAPSLFGRGQDELSPEVKPEAYRWHYKPMGKRGQGRMGNKNCPVCGYSAKRVGQHRRVADAEPYSRRFLSRTEALEVTEVGPLKVLRVNRAPTGPSKAMIAQIVKVVGMLAAGKQLEEAAKELDVSPSAVSYWRVTHADIWKKAYDHAVGQQLELVRAQAGTDAAIENPAEFLAKALVVERWATKKGIELFPKTVATTLTTFYETYMLPVCLSEGNKPGSIANYEYALKRWRLFTGDPPLAEITNATMATFREACKKLTTHKGTRLVSPATVRNFMRWIQAILDKAAPPGRHNRDAAGIIATAPYAKPPRAVEKEPKIVRLDVLEQVLLATVGMEVPRFDGIKPPAWWRGILLTALYTGLRRRTLFSLLMTDISWNDRLLVIPGKRIKTGRPHTVPLHDACFAALLAIRTDRKKVFPWPHDLTWFNNRFHLLQTMAGLKRSEHFGLHGLRRTHCTLLWEGSPAAAQLSLGHRQGSSVTAASYVGKDGIVSRAIAALPTLGAFKGTGGKEGAA